MKKFILSICILVGSVACADNVPPYIQVQVDNINQQITQLKTQRDEMTAKMNTMKQDPNANRTFAQQETQTQVDNVNKHIEQLERQKAALTK
ncbi:MAG: hypothetical protein JSS12_09665 [Verrucomicrobia bacterium]|nr:hypothetical protein [Verrucomicrobiota bacterium]